jgi:2-oxoacid:acceptor oxidoreductase delta subunit (pyruvate/2-ketoisovalerate family)
MRGLSAWEDLPRAGVVEPATAPRVRTGGWRTGVKPSASLDQCVNCLLCWVYCPDSAIVLEGEMFAGFDYDVCKGCELCSVVCPEGAITMVADGAG